MARHNQDDDYDNVLAIAHIPDYKNEPNRLIDRGQPWRSHKADRLSASKPPSQASPPERSVNDVPRHPGVAGAVSGFTT